MIDLEALAHQYPDYDIEVTNTRFLTPWGWHIALTQRGLTVYYGNGRILEAALMALRDTIMGKKK